LSDIKHDIGVYANSEEIDEYILQPTYANIGSMACLDNQNGDSLVTADVACLDVSNDEAIVEASSSAPYLPAFVVPSDIDTDGVAQSKTILDTEAGWVNKPGAYCPAAAVDDAVAIGEYLEYSATAKKFTGTGITSRRPRTAQAIALAAAVGAGNIPVLLLAPFQQIAKSVRVYNDANIACSAGVEKTLTFNSETYDDAGFHSTVSDTERLTAPADQIGSVLYEVSLSVELSTAATNWVMIKTGANVALAVISADQGYYATICAHTKLAAGEWVEAHVLSVAGCNVVRTSDYSPIFSMIQIGE
jgi:hypothetical protein